MALTKIAVQRPHVLIVEVPGWSLTKIATEQELRRRGWVQSNSPAESDILLTCGIPGTELTEVIDRVWNQLPGPRVRLGATHPHQVADLLDQARAALLDHIGQRNDAITRTSDEFPPTSVTQNHGSEGGPDHGGMDHGEMDHGGMDHGGMDHGGMDMPMPGGIGLAEGGSDRDGLDLDVLHLSLGPVLRHWPAGLVVRCSLQGDVITEASVEVLTGSLAVKAPDAGGTSEGVAGLGDDALRLSCAGYCDHAAGLLALMEWERFSSAAFRVRDEVLGGMPLEHAAAELDRLARRVGRSRFLRWSLKDLPEVLERLSTLLNRARMALDTDRGEEVEALRLTPDEESARLHQVPEMITGLDLAAARLVIASLGLDTAAARAGSDHA